MNLELNKEEAELLSRILADYLGNLRMEVAGTDSYDFREGLKADEERLKTILGRLGHPIAAGATVGADKPPLR